MFPFSKWWKREPPPAPSSKKPLLVGSVFAPSERNARWLALQMHFLRQTVPSFDHAVFLNRVPPDLFTESLIIGQAEPQLPPSQEHGRALDKVLGYGLLEGKLPFDAHILLVSGRTSFEILQKSLAGRIPIICSVSAPSSLAVEFAQESGQTLVGFLRGESMNIYSHAERILKRV